MNCIVVDDDEIDRKFLEILISKTSFLNLVQSCTSSMEASDVVLNHKIDLIFLDVEMPEMTGLEFIKVLAHNKPQVILVTSKQQYAIDAFDYDVADFIVKPVTQDRFIKAVMKAKEIIDSQNKNASYDHDIFVKSDSQLIKLKTSDILYIEGMENYVVVHTASQSFTLHTTMKGIGSKLPSNQFLRIHQSYIVRLDKISKIEDNTLVMSGGKMVTVSRSLKQTLMDRLKLI